MADLAFGGRCDRIAHRCVKVLMILMTYLISSGQPSSSWIEGELLQSYGRVLQGCKIFTRGKFSFHCSFSRVFLLFSLISGDPDRWLQNAQHQHCAPVNWEAMWFQPSVRDAYGGQRDLGVADRFWRFRFYVSHRSKAMDHTLYILALCN